MKKMTLYYQNNKIDFSINKLKYFYGSENSVYSIFNGIRYIFSKNSLSEYGKENLYQNMINIDEKSLDVKNTIFFEFSENFNLSDECKIGTKSILSKVLETYFSKMELDETLQTINILIDDFINKMIEDFNEEDIPIIIDDLVVNSKFLMKNITISFLKDELRVNQQDYTYLEFMQLQLSLLKYLVRNNPQILFFILVTKKIEVSELLNYNNVFIFSTIFLNELEIKDIYLVERKIDLFDEQEIYNLFTEFPIKEKFEDYKIELLNKIKKG